MYNHIGTCKSYSLRVEIGIAQQFLLLQSSRKGHRSCTDNIN